MLNGIPFSMEIILNSIERELGETYWNYFVLSHAVLELLYKKLLYIRKYQQYFTFLVFPT